MNLKSGCLVCIVGFVGVTALGVILPIVWSWGLSAVVWLILFLVKSSFKVILKK